MRQLGQPRASVSPLHPERWLGGSTVLECQVPHKAPGQRGAKVVAGRGQQLPDCRDEVVQVRDLWVDAGHTCEAEGEDEATM